MGQFSVTIPTAAGSVLSDIQHRFFAYFVAANKQKIMRLVSGVTVYHIYGSDLATLHLAIPHPAEQRKIAEFLSAIDRKIELVGAELEHAKTFKKGLLQQMFV
jgi:type I restriction enzyme S subunit